MYITIQTADDIDYNKNEKNIIYRDVNDTIRKFFAAYCVVGADVSIKGLTGALHSALSNFKIANIEIDIANSQFKPPVFIDEIRNAFSSEIKEFLINFNIPSTNNICKRRCVIFIIKAIYGYNLLCLVF